MSTANQLLLEFILILIVPYLLPTKFADSYIAIYVFRDLLRQDFHLKLVKLMDVFKSSGYPDNYISSCFKTILDNKHRISEKVITLPIKPLLLVLPYLGPLSIQTIIKLRKCLKGILSCCKLQIVFMNQNKLTNTLCFQDRIPKELTSGVVYKFQYELCNESYYGKCVRHLNVRIGDHIGISQLTKKNVKPNGSDVSDHLLLCNLHHLLKILVC